METIEELKAKLEELKRKLKIREEQIREAKLREITDIVSKLGYKTTEKK